jgi:protein arginine N-methyltransferase 1
MTEHYELWDHGSFLRDEVRVGSYVRALQALISPGATILEIGTGTGFFAVVAAKLGAGHVDGVEPDEVVRLARGVVEMNGVADRVTLYKGRFDEFDTSTKYDVIFSDLRGCLPYFGDNLSSCIRARRFLKSEGAQIPSRDDVFVSPVCLPNVYSDYLDPWARKSWGIDLSFCLPFIAARLAIVHADDDCLLAPPALWSSIDYPTVSALGHSGDMSWELHRAGVLHGYLAWFDSILMPGVTLSNRPGAPPLVYGQMFFPIATPVQVLVGTGVSLRLSAEHLTEEHYTWTWDSHIDVPGRRATSQSSRATS